MRRFLVSVVALGAVVLSATDPVRSAESTSAVAAWGLNGNGQVGDGTSGNARVNAVTVNGLTDVAAVAGGYLHSLALKRDGTVWAWGDNSFGQLGNGTTMPSLVPVKVSSLTNVTAVAANSHFSFALRNPVVLGRELLRSTWRRYRRTEDTSRSGRWAHECAERRGRVAACAGRGERRLCLGLGMELLRSIGQWHDLAVLVRLADAGACPRYSGDGLGCRRLWA